MAKNTDKPADNTPARLDAFLVDEYESQGEKRSHWSKVGSAWPHADGKGYRVVLKSIPVDGVVILRTPEAKED